MSIVSSAAATQRPERNDVLWISDTLIPSLAADGKLRSAGAAPAEVRHVEIKPLSIAESFMMTKCYKIRVTLAGSAGPSAEVDDEVVQMVVKITPDVTAELLKLVCFEQLFHNEVTAYGEIFPAIGWSENYPKCYYSHNRPDGAAIVLSDFTADGWRMSHVQFNLSLEHILVAVAELGKLHGIMYGRKHTDRSAFDRMCGTLRESRFVLDRTSEQWDRRLRIGPRRSTNAVRASIDPAVTVPESFLKRLETVLENPFAYQKRVALRQREPLANLCHGDFLRNNIAFKYVDEKSEIPVSAMMFDFQTLRYASPMLDLVTFMVNSTGVEVRRQHFDHIFAAYHTALCNHFSAVTGIPETDAAFPAYLSVDVFMREYALYLPYGLSIGASFLPMLHVPITVAFEEFTSGSDEREMEDAWTRGGEALDAELRAIVTEMYTLYSKYGLELEENF